MRGLSILAALVLCLVIAGPASAADPPPGGEHSEAYFDTPDGTTLHADVIRPAGIPEDERTPVILTVSPYTNHSGGPLTPDLGGGPSSRFYDFLADGQVLQKGYTYVMVDLRGTGGSGGCNDWGGPGEQSDVKAAVEWAASQEWSTGKVALYGKSYDAWTGLMAMGTQRPTGLAAVISQEPVVDGYRYLYMNRVPFSNRLGTPGLFQVIDAQPGHPLDDPNYHLNSAPKPECYGPNVANQQNPDPESDYWKPRNLVDAVKGSTTPTFLMAGFLEDNTKPDALFDLWSNLSGPNQAWFGQWDHIRGNDKDEDGTYLAGRDTFIPEVMAFLDHHLKGEGTQPRPGVTVQTGDGSFRREERWPPADSAALATTLRGGSYTDDGGNNGTCGSDERGGECSGPVGQGIWSISQPLDQTAHLAGTPRLTVDAGTAGANLVANVYDIGPDRLATMVSRGATLTPASGTTSLELYGEDWQFEPGHRIGVLLTDANDEWFDHEPTDREVALSAASIALPFLPAARGPNLDGGPAAKLISYREEAPFEVPQETIDSSSTTFAAPRSQPAGATESGSRSAAGTTESTARRASGRLGVRLARRGSRLVAYGRAPAGARRVSVGLRRDGKRVARRSTTARAGRFRVTFKPRRVGRFRARASARGASGALRGRSRPVRIRSLLPRGTSLPD